MEKLLLRSAESVANTSLRFQRYLAGEIHWDWRMVGIKGARGVGKTTLMLQQLKRRHGILPVAIYLSLDDIYFTEHRFIEVAEQLQTRGVTHFYLDEVHKYPDWARELKNIYDRFPALSIAFTGSSILEINKLEVDLSRRAVMYELRGLSFREYLELIGVAILPPLTLDDLTKRHTELALDLSRQFKPLQFFGDYLRQGYYPYFIENQTAYLQRLTQTIQLAVETDLNFIEGASIRNARKILQLLYVIATSVPFKPNIAQLGDRLGIERNTLLRYLHYLEKANLLLFLNAPNKGGSLLQKPDKIYLENTNLAHALAPETPDAGNLRETFFFNQVRQKYPVAYAEYGDFRVADRYTFEVGGRNKKSAQIRHLPEAFLAVADLETGIGNQIPLWLFGFLY